MASSPSSIPDDKYSIGILLGGLLFLSLWLSLKSFILERTDAASETQSQGIPNILLIVADDLGYDDTTAINPGGLSTPNIKQLAERGVTFRRHYADATCTPSRVALLTGRHPERSGFRPVGIEIPREYATIAQQLETAGYTTYLTGKWHAGEERPEAWPENKGFGQWYGFLNQWELSGEVTDSNKGGMKKPTYNNPMLRKNGGKLVQQEGHLTDILTEHTIAKINELSTSGKPWFIYHAFLAPHHPIQPAQRYRDKFPNTPEGEYTALVTQLDDAVGRIIAAVDQENTLIVFLSDNGGTNKQRDNNYPFYGKKGDIYEGAYRTPLIIHWPGRIPSGKTVDDVVMNVDIYPTLLAAAMIEQDETLDGQNLWPLILNDISVSQRARSWEVFSPNVSTLGFSYLSDSGRWRLSSVQGLPPGLYDLDGEAAGKTDVAAQHESLVADLTAQFWREYWGKSLLNLAAEHDAESGQTVYTGFDTMRTPYRYGFTIGLEIGPLPDKFTDLARAADQVLAGQENFWELRYKNGQGLEWEIGDTILRDPYFEPSRCNALILTGYFAPLAHLAKRDPASQLRVYSSGFLRDVKKQFDFSTIAGENPATGTFVNFNGQAKISNMMLSAFGESYAPRVADSFLDIYTSLYQQEKLSLADIKLMDSQLCRSGKLL